MSFNIPGSGAAGGNGPFLGRIQYDTRTGFWTVVKRTQDASGMWSDQSSEPMRNPQFLLDAGTLEIGYIKFASPPAFLLVPYGQTIPQQPEEMVQDAMGKKKKAFQPGFRVKLASQKTFGDADAYYFAQNSKTVLDVMDDLHNRFETAPEAAAGKVPLVTVTGTRVVEFKTPQGTTKFYAPVMEFASWHERLPIFGDRTVPAPAPRAAAPHAATIHAPQPVPGTQGAPAPAPQAAPAPAPARVSPAAPDAMPEF